MNAKTIAVGIVAAGISVYGCSQPNEEFQGVPQPKAIIDLGALVTEDVAYRVWGEDALAEYGLDRPNTFEVVRNELGLGDGRNITVQNSFFTLASHGGPHVDAPVHVDLGPGLDGYPVDAFAGPLKVFDVRDYPSGRSVPKATFFDKEISPGDVVLIYTGWQSGSGFDVITLTLEAAEYLAKIPVRAFGTDALSLFDADSPPAEVSDLHVRALPIHHTFLSRRIPIYEQLFNIDQTLEHDRMYFVGAPLNIQDGDGMIVRPLVFVY
jgi:kynurenine formamidase